MTANPFDMYPVSDDPLYQTLDSLRVKRGERDTAWKAFEEARDQAARANRLEDDSIQQHLTSLEEDYKRAVGQTKELEERHAELALKRVGTGQSAGQIAEAATPAPAPEGKAWARSVVSKLIERKALDATSGGTIPAPFYDPNLRRLPERNLFVRTLIPVITATGDRASYLRQTVRTNDAAPVTDGDTKQTSVFSVERVEAPFQTIAHLSEPVQRQLLADFDGLTRFLDAELRLGVLLAEEDQILNGDGTPPNLEGILSTDIGDQPLGGDSISDALLRGLNVVRNEGLVEPDAIVMNPADYENAALEKTDGSGEYIHGSPNDSTTPTLWGKPVITSPVLDAGTALVGNFAQGCAIYDREQPRVDFSDQSGELFEKNQVVFRGEERLSFAVFRPKAFATVSDLTPGP